jgi:hypothetical protein
MEEKEDVMCTKCADKVNCYKKIIYKHVFENGEVGKSLVYKGSVIKLNYRLNDYNNLFVDKCYDMIMRIIVSIIHRLTILRVDPFFLSDELDRISAGEDKLYNNLDFSSGVIQIVFTILNIVPKLVDTLEVFRGLMKWGIADVIVNKGKLRILCAGPNLEGYYIYNFVKMSFNKKIKIETFDKYKWSFSYNNKFDQKVKMIDDSDIDGPTYMSYGISATGIFVRTSVPEILEKVGSDFLIISDHYKNQFPEQVFRPFFEEDKSKGIFSNWPMLVMKLIQSGKMGSADQPEVIGDNACMVHDSSIINCSCLTVMVDCDIDSVIYDAEFLINNTQFDTYSDLLDYYYSFHSIEHNNNESYMCSGNLVENIRKIGYFCPYKDDESLYEYVKKHLDNSSNNKRMINDVFDFVRSVDGLITLSAENTDKYIRYKNLFKVFEYTDETTAECYNLPKVLSPEAKPFYPKIFIHEGDSSEDEEYEFVGDDYVPVKQKSNNIKGDEKLEKDFVYPTPVRLKENIIDEIDTSFDYSSDDQSRQYDVK